MACMGRWFNTNGPRIPLQRREKELWVFSEPERFAGRARAEGGGIVLLYGHYGMNVATYLTASCDYFFYAAAAVCTIRVV